MSVLWAGGEDIDFQAGAAPVVDTSGGHYRSGYARCCLTVPASGVTIGNPIPSGPLTSGWISFQWAGSNTGYPNPSFRGPGVIDAAGHLLTLWNDGSNKCWLIDCTGNHLASESGNSLINGIQRFDIQISNFGATAVVNVYLNGSLTPLITFSGDIRGTGAVMTNFTNVAAIEANAYGYGGWLSEVFVTSDDSRAYVGMCTHALSGAGTTNVWSNNTYTNINGISFSDANAAYDNTPGDDAQYNLNDLPAGSFVIAAVKITVRGAQGAGSTTTGAKLGYNSGGTVGFGTGATKTFAGAEASYEQLDLVNPVTGVAFTPSEINALQLDMRAN